MERREVGTGDGARGWLGRTSGWATRHEGVLWAALLAVVVAVQWPVLKGHYYRLVDATPPSTTIEWRTDLDAALLEARHSGKQVLVDFSADWCPPCIAMKHDVWPHPQVQRLLAERYVPVLIDVDRDAAVPARYEIQGIPAVLVLDHDGEVLRRATFLTAPALVQLLTESR